MNKPVQQFLGHATRYLNGIREARMQPKASTPVKARTSSRLELLLPFNWPNSDSDVQWCIFDGNEIREQGSTDKLEEITQKRGSLPVHVWLAAGDCLLTQADVPTISRSKLVKAVPYALEDRLLGDVDQQFFTWNRKKGKPLDICVVAHGRMKTVIGELKAHGLEPQVVAPVVLRAAMLDNSWTLVINQTEAWLRTGEFGGLNCELTNNEPPYALVQLLTEARQQDSAPSGLLLINAPPSIDTKQWASALDLQLFIPEGGVWENMDRQPAPMNLLQGPYTFKTPRQTLSRKLLPAGIMLALILLANLGAGTWQWWKLRSEANRLHTDMVALFKQTFPQQASTVIDPVQQMQRNLDLLRQDKGGASHNDFLTLLGPVSRALGNSGNVSTLGYREGRLSISLRLDNYQALDILKAKLGQQNLQVEIAEANSDATGVTTVLKVSSSAGSIQ